VAEIAQSFDIDQPPQAVWRFFQDVPRVVSCMPGLEYGGPKDDEADSNIHRGKVRIKLGPVSAAFEGEAAILEADDAALTARIEGKGIDKKGGSRASASVVYKIVENGGGSRVQLDADIKLSGALAQMGRTGIVQDVAAHITEQFAESLRATLAAEATPANGQTAAPSPPAVAEEIRGDTLMLKIIWRRIKALFGWRGPS
jgi:carbon monoxide dehydrogenase subunit G